MIGFLDDLRPSGLSTSPLDTHAKYMCVHSSPHRRGCVLHSELTFCPEVLAVTSLSVLSFFFCFICCGGFQHKRMKQCLVRIPVCSNSSSIMPEWESTLISCHIKHKQILLLDFFCHSRQEEMEKRMN